METLEIGFSRLGLDLSPVTASQFKTYHRQLVEWNSRVNLTAITDCREVESRHFLDSLTVSAALSDAAKASGRLVDVGSGAGFPGLPLKLAYPGMHVTAVESSGKKSAFISHIVEVLGADDVEICTQRAEIAARDPVHRETFDAAVSRGVASLRVISELCLPFCRLGGVTIAMKKGDIRQEVEDASHAIDLLGGRLKEILPVEAPGLDDDRVLVVIDKLRPTPEKYPRRPGIPGKRPL